MRELHDERSDDQSRELWSMKDQFETEIRADTRNVLILAGALAAFIMPAFAAAAAVSRKLAFGTALLCFLLAIIVGCLRLVFLLVDARTAINDLLAWKESPDEKAKLRFEQRESEIELSSQSGLLYLIWTQALFVAGIAVLMLGVIMELVSVLIGCGAKF